MNSRMIIRTLFLVAAGSTAATTSASETTTCPGGGAGPAALTKVGGRSFSAEGGGSREMQVTAYCVGCHDGSISGTVLVTSRGGTQLLNGLFGTTAAISDLRSMHPVDVAYPTARRGFRPLSQVELALPLDVGRVTCETCHSGDDSTPFSLTVSNVGSRLCLTCHEK